jgi:PAS domain S-box-containing protein
MPEASSSHPGARQSAADVFEHIFESSPLAIMSFTLDREVLAINSMAERLLGWKAAEVIGKRFNLPPSAEPDWQRMRATLERGEAVHNLVTKRYNKKGEELAVLISATPVLGTNGKVKSFTAVISDTAPMVRLEKALGESEQRRSLALQAADIGSWCFDLRTRNVEWDQRCKRLFGVPPRTPDLGLEEFLRFIHQEDREATRNAIWHAIDTKIPYDMRHRVIWPDGRVHWLRCKGDVDDQNDPTCLIGITLDVTWLKRNEDLVRSVERLKANAELGSTLAHELNNPMEILCNALYLLGMELGPDHQSLSIANDAYDRVSGITRQLLAMHARPAHPEHIEVSEVAERAIEEANPSAQARSVTLRSNLQKVEMFATPIDLKHLIRNLLENALEHTPGNGIIEVRTYPSNDHIYGTRCGARVVVADNGPGIPDELCARLFQPFISTKEKKGAGLGLWVAQAIARKYGGFVRIKTSTRLGRSGTCVSVFLRSLKAYEGKSKTLAAYD